MQSAAMFEIANGITLDVWIVRVLETCTFKFSDKICAFIQDWCLYCNLYYLGQQCILIICGF